MTFNLLMGSFTILSFTAFVFLAIIFYSYKKKYLVYVNDLSYDARIQYCFKFTAWKHLELCLAALFIATLVSGILYIKAMVSHQALDVNAGVITAILVALGMFLWALWEGRQTIVFFNMESSPLWRVLFTTPQMINWLYVFHIKTRTGVIKSAQIIFSCPDRKRMKLGIPLGWETAMMAIFSKMTPEAITGFSNELFALYCKDPSNFKEKAKIQT